MRTSTINRKTAETDITLALEIDGDGKSSLRTGSGMLDHMLTLFARHGLFDLRVECDGDVEVGRDLLGVERGEQPGPAGAEDQDVGLDLLGAHRASSREAIPL